MKEFWKGFKDQVQLGVFGMNQMYKAIRKAYGMEELRKFARWHRLHVRMAIIDGLAYLRIYSPYGSDAAILYAGWGMVQSRFLLYRALKHGDQFSHTLKKLGFSQEE